MALVAQLLGKLPSLRGERSNTPDMGSLFTHALFLLAFGKASNEELGCVNLDRVSEILRVDGGHVFRSSHFDWCRDLLVCCKVIRKADEWQR